MKLINIFLVVLSFTFISFLTSCSKENVDQDIIEEETIEPGVTVVTPADCGNIVVASTPLNFDGASKAVLMKKDAPCADASNYKYNYLVVDADFNYHGDDPNYYTASDGIPGFLFSFYDTPMVGSSTTLHKYDQFMTFDNVNDYRFTEDITFEVLEAGTQIGENISGLISGNLVDSNGTEFPFTAEFCSPIVSVCD